MDGMCLFLFGLDTLRNLFLQSLAGSAYEYRSRSGKATTESDRLGHHEVIDFGDKGLGVDFSIHSSCKGKIS